MKENNHKLNKHIFICTRCKPESDLENESYAAELRAELKKRCLEEFGKNGLRVNASGCLGQCKEGIHGVIYPEGKWLKNLEKSSIPQIIDYVKTDS